MEPKYYVKIIESAKPLKPDPRVKDILKGALSPKMMSRLKKEYVHCPVIEKDLPFLNCYACVSFIRRIKGVVHCAGGPCEIKE